MTERHGSIDTAKDSEQECLTCILWDHPCLHLPVAYFCTKLVYPFVTINKIAVIYFILNCLVSPIILLIFIRFIDFFYQKKSLKAILNKEISKVRTIII